MLNTWISVVSALVAVGSLVFTVLQWRKVNAKVAMISDSGLAAEVLPAWYIRRMMDDYWFFGLKTMDGQLIGIRKIRAVSDDGKWMDVELLTGDELPVSPPGFTLVAVGDDRRAASIRIDSIVSAHDLAAT